MTDHLTQDLKSSRDLAIKDLDRIERLTRLLDSQFRLPGTNIRFGLDPLIGALPGFGDAISLLISGYLVILMIRRGVSGQVVLMMIGNVVFDFLLGTIPGIGDIADFFNKANSRNIRLLRRYYQEGKYRRSAVEVILLVGVVIMVMVGLTFWALFSLVAWLF